MAFIFFLSIISGRSKANPIKSNTNFTNLDTLDQNDMLSQCKHLKLLLICIFRMDSTTYNSINVGRLLNP